MRYHGAILLRFLVLAIPLALLTIGLFSFGAETLGFETGPSLGPGEALPAFYVVGAWLLEAMALSALFLLVAGRTATVWLDALFAALAAWVFRGPLLVLTVVSVTRRTAEALWRASLAWLVLYVLLGLLLAWLARRTRLGVA